MKERETQPTPDKQVAAPTSIVQGKLKKQSGFSKFMRSLIADDLPSVKGHILDDVLRPAISGFIINAVTDAISMVFRDGGDVRRDRSRADRVSYREYYPSSASRDDKKDDYRGYSDETPTVPARSDCVKVQNAMHDILNRYHYVRVSDLLDLCNLPSKYTDSKYGWVTHEEIDRAKFYRMANGWYSIEMPPSHPLD
jgi:hypothetical protein